MVGCLVGLVGWIDGWTVGGIDLRMDGWLWGIDRQMVGWMNGWMDAWVSGWFG